MSAVTQNLKNGPETYIPAEAIAGGQLVEARGSSRVGVAAADSLVVLGIAVTDGVNPEAFVSTPTTPTGGLPTLDATQRQNNVVVAYGGITVFGVTYAAAASFGQKLKAAASGQVTPLLVSDDPRKLIGICAEPAGVSSAGVGRVRTI